MSEPARILVLGGTRSGKSTFAVRLARERGGEHVTYIATARPGDPELDARIAAHRRDRPAWPVIETASDLARAVRAAPPADVLLIDSLTLWASTVLEERDDIALRWQEADRALAGRERATILVSDEIGLGMVPLDASARAYRDELGQLHQRVAASADQAWLMVAGLPLRLK